MNAAASAVPVFAGDLPPSKTYARRSWLWVRCDPAGDGRLGTLTITLAKSFRADAKTETDSYAVEEEFPPVGWPGCRSFLLLNLTDPGQEEVYRLSIDTRFYVCSCKAGRCKVPDGCKHGDSIRAAIIEGGL